MHVCPGMICVHVCPGMICVHVCPGMICVFITGIPGCSDMAGELSVSALGSQDNLHNYTMYVYMRSKVIKALGHNTRADCLL